MYNVINNAFINNHIEAQLTEEQMIEALLHYAISEHKSGLIVNKRDRGDLSDQKQLTYQPW